MSGEVGAGWAVVSTRTLFGASVVELDIRASSVGARHRHVAVPASRACVADGFSITESERSRDAGNGSGGASGASVTPSADVLSCGRRSSGAEVSSGAESSGAGEAHGGAVGTSGAGDALVEGSAAGAVGEGGDGASVGTSGGVGAVIAAGADVAGDVVGGRGRGCARRAVVSGKTFIGRIDRSLTRGGAVVSRCARDAASDIGQSGHVGPGASRAREFSGEVGARRAVVAAGASVGFGEVGRVAEVRGVAEVSSGAGLALGETGSIGVVARIATELSACAVGAVVSDVAHVRGWFGGELARRAVESTVALRADGRHARIGAVITADAREAREDAGLRGAGTVGAGQTQRGCRGVDGAVRARGAHVAGDVVGGIGDGSVQRAVVAARAVAGGS